MMVMVGLPALSNTQSVQLSEGAGPEAAVRLPTAGGVRGITAGVGGSWFTGMAVRSRGRNPAETNNDARRGVSTLLLAPASAWRTVTQPQRAGGIRLPGVVIIARA